MKRALLVLAVLLLLGYLATGVYQVQPGELAIVRRFGRVLDEPRLPGLNIGLPWGLDRVDRVAIDEQRQITVGFVADAVTDPQTAPPGQVLTGDNNLVDLQVKVFYTIARNDPRAAVRFVLNQDRIEPLLIRAADSALIAELATEQVDRVLLGQSRTLESRIQERLTEVIQPYRIGVSIASVNLTHIQPPEELVEAFREVNRARTQMQIAEREALSYRQTEVSAARQSAERERARALAAYRDRVRQAQVEADNFLVLWHNLQAAGADRDTALLTLYLKEMRAILAGLQVRTVSDHDVDQTVILPLPER